MIRPLDPAAYYLGADARRWLAEARLEGARQALEAMRRPPKRDTRPIGERFAELADMFEPEPQQ
jgi:hypothetical protein